MGRKSSGFPCFQLLPEEINSGVSWFESFKVQRGNACSTLTGDIAQSFEGDLVSSALVVCPAGKLESVFFEPGEEFDELWGEFHSDSYDSFSGLADEPHCFVFATHCFSFLLVCGVVVVVFCVFVAALTVVFVSQWWRIPWAIPRAMSAGTDILPDPAAHRTHGRHSSTGGTTRRGRASTRLERCRLDNGERITLRSGDIIGHRIR